MPSAKVIMALNSFNAKVTSSSDLMAYESKSSTSTVSKVVIGREARESAVAEMSTPSEEGADQLNALFSALATTSGASYDLILHCCGVQ